MLKRNLFAIIFVSLVTIFSTNAFGQWHPDLDNIPTRLTTRTNKIQKTVTKSIGETKNVDLSQIKSPRDTATGQIVSPRDVASGQATNKVKRNNGLIDTSTGEIVWINSQNDAATGQVLDAGGVILGDDVQIKPKVKGYELGDTATHERRGKATKKRKH